MIFKSRANGDRAHGQKNQTPGTGRLGNKNKKLGGPGSRANNIKDGRKQIAGGPHQYQQLLLQFTKWHGMTKQMHRMTLGGLVGAAAVRSNSAGPGANDDARAPAAALAPPTPSEQIVERSMDHSIIENYEWARCLN